MGAINEFCTFKANLFAGIDLWETKSKTLPKYIYILFIFPKLYAQITRVHLLFEAPVLILIQLHGAASKTKKFGMSALYKSGFYLPIHLI